MLRDYLKYLLKSHNLHGVHSPFVYELNERVLNTRPEAKELETVNSYRNFLKRQKLQLLIEDLGSGSHRKKYSDRSIKNLYKTSSTNKRMGEILFRIIKYYDYKNILEIGTCLGVGTSYMQAALLHTPEARITTIEGSKSLVDFTSKNFKNFFPDNKVKFAEGNFDRVLPEILTHLPPVDLAFVDGNHNFDSTLNYFNLLLNKIHNNSVIIFDDIYWSEEMKNAWTEIKLHPSVTCSVDLFRWGLVFFRKEMPKEHFTLRFDGFLQAHIS